MFKDLFSQVRMIYSKVKLAKSSLNLMASDNPKVSGYLPPAVYNVPPAIYDHLIAFKAKRGLQSVEMAVNVILSEYFELFQAPVLTGTDTTASRLETLEAKCTSLSQTVAELRAAIATLQASSSPPLGESEPPPSTALRASQNGATDKLTETGSLLIEPQSELLYESRSYAAPRTPDHSSTEAQNEELAIPEPLNQPFSTPMTQAALARRLGVNTSSISRMQSKPNFSEWSQQKDPEGIAWVRSPDTKLFHPQIHK